MELRRTRGASARKNTPAFETSSLSWDTISCCDQAGVEPPTAKIVITVIPIPQSRERNLALQIVIAILPIHRPMDRNLALETPI